MFVFVHDTKKYKHAAIEIVVEMIHGTNLLNLFPNLCKIIYKMEILIQTVTKLKYTINE